jgi:hypothetical protein
VHGRAEEWPVVILRHAAPRDCEPDLQESPMMARKKGGAKRAANWSYHCAVNYQRM